MSCFKGAGAAGGVMSQEAYNEMIQENMSDFDMSLEESVKETLKQCQSMGINLDSIDVSGGQERALLDVALESLTAGQISLDGIKTIHKQCDSKGNEFCLRNQNIVYNKRGVQSLSLLLDPSSPIDVAMAAANAIVTISLNHDRNR